MDGVQPVPGPSRELAARSLKALIATGALALLAMIFAIALWQYPPPSLGLVLIGGVLLIAILALAIARYDVAVGLGFLMIGMVKFDPAPPDLVFAIVIAVAATTGRFEPRHAPLSILALLGAFISLTLLSAMQALDPMRAAVFFGITAFLVVFGVWLTDYLDRPRRAQIVAGGYVAAAVISASLGTLAVMGVIPGADLFVNFERAQGLFQDPNVFGPFLIPAALIIVDDIMQPRLLNLNRLFKIAMLFMLGVGVLFSFSRAAYLNLAVAVIAMVAIYVVRRGGGRRALVLLGIVIVGVIAGTIVLSAAGLGDFLGERTSSHAYDSERFGAQAAGADLASRYVLGIGPGQFEVIQPLSTHSLYVRVLAEQGVLGLVVWATLLLVTLMLALRNALLGRSTYGIGSAALFASWIGLLANSAFVDTLHWRHLWMVAAMIWAASMRRPDADADY